MYESYEKSCDKAAKFAETTLWCLGCKCPSHENYTVLLSHALNIYSLWSTRCDSSYQTGSVNNQNAFYTAKKEQKRIGQQIFRPDFFHNWNSMFSDSKLAATSRPKVKLQKAQLEIFELERSLLQTSTIRDPPWPTPPHFCVPRFKFKKKPREDKSRTKNTFQKPHLSNETNLQSVKQNEFKISQFANKKKNRLYGTTQQAKSNTSWR